MLKVNINKPIASVLLDRPDVHNAFNDAVVAFFRTQLGSSDKR